jgi:hypothetical protein
MNDAQHNPYAPPKAPVAEIEESIARPEAVGTAMKLLWISLGLTFAEIALDWEGQAAGGLVAFLVFTAIGIAITVWLLLKIRVGRNWARITHMILTAMTFSWFSTRCIYCSFQGANGSGVARADPAPHLATSKHRRSSRRQPGNSSIASCTLAGLPCANVAPAPPPV